MHLINVGEDLLDLERAEALLMPLLLSLRRLTEKEGYFVETVLSIIFTELHAKAKGTGIDSSICSSLSSTIYYSQETATDRKGAVVTPILGLSAEPMQPRKIQPGIGDPGSPTC